MDHRRFAGKAATVKRAVVAGTRVMGTRVMGTGRGIGSSEETLLAPESVRATVGAFVIERGNATVGVAQHRIA